MSPTATAGLASVMTQDAPLHEHPDHAAVLAVVCAYERSVGPMPYALLRTVMGSLAALGDQAALRPDGRSRTALVLHEVVSDLRRLDLVDLVSSGTVLTSAGEARLDTETARDRVGNATAALRRLDLV